ncbi:MAG: hypothetical protein A3G34_04885 [Candidatus Lindowbacteria bacterium RIFCSPLOWO2_12_FULL_62_27]|nr:MAG: hypothetical protein A3I06_13205 [Candidatus Lindowbacteria bacterium RIFCSPLOWO2_02_FULL_62_12]OGH61333.1 MAG: hypothetical protein A3G34_04885 [Candidatus Lindowbacteria bacterium RIFCSPLOWO2_12_FULL_62_27]
MLGMNQELEQARLEIERLKNENAELRKTLGLLPAEPQPHLEMGIREVVIDSMPLPSMTKDSPTKEKVALFRMLFRGRDDVYALRWENERTGKRGYSPVREGGAVGKAARSKKCLPLTDRAVQDHLSGEKIIGAYPLLLDNTCWFLACDFDKEGWTLDSPAYLNVCNRYGVPACLERSRSGNGGHVWIFFFRHPFRRLRPDSWGCDCFEKQWLCAARWISPVTTDFFRIRTLSPKADLEISSPCRSRRNAGSLETRNS